MGESSGEREESSGESLVERRVVRKGVRRVLWEMGSIVGRGESLVKRGVV